MAEFQWTEKATLAAMALAEGMTRAAAAKHADISDRSLYRWLANPEFMAEVDRLSLMVGIATRAERLRLVQRVIRQRVTEEGILSKADILDWLKFAQSETTGAVDDLADRIAALMADRQPT
jgi:transposase-like protein